MGWDMKLKEETNFNNHSKFPSRRWHYHQRVSWESFYSFLSPYSHHADILAPPGSWLLACLFLFFYDRWLLLYSLKSFRPVQKQITPSSEVIRRIRRTLSLTWDVIWGFDAVSNPCWNTHCQILFIQNCGLPWL